VTPILIVVVAAVAVGLLAGGSIRSFPTVPIRWWPLAVIGLGLQFAPIRDRAAFAALVASMVLLLWFAFINLRSPGFILILMGLMLNAVVIMSNHGMPVTRTALAGSDRTEAVAVAELRKNGGAKHHLADDGSVLLPLADAIGIPAPVGAIVSVGDVCVYLGVGWFVAAALRPRR
jgi:Family of unknown function (DUF5317)